MDNVCFYEICVIEVLVILFINIKYYFLSYLSYSFCIYVLNLKEYIILNFLFVKLSVDRIINIILFGLMLIKLR